MSRMTTSSASFSRARAAMRRACSRDVRVESDPWRVGPAECSPASRTVKTPLLEEPADRRGDEAVERLAGGGAGADVARCLRLRLDLEEEDALGAVQLREHGVERLAGAARPGGHGEARALEHLVGALQSNEVLELVGADHEQAVAEVLVPLEVDRPI